MRDSRCATERPSIASFSPIGGCCYALAVIVLSIVTGQSAGQSYELYLPVLSIGRAPTNQVVLGDYHLSGEHGQIFREDDRYIYRDLRSTNGSRIQRGPEELNLDGSERWEAPLEDGDQLMLGNPAEPVVIK